MKIRKEGWIDRAGTPMMRAIDPPRFIFKRGGRTWATQVIAREVSNCNTKFTRLDYRKNNQGGEMCDGTVLPFLLFSLILMGTKELSL